MDKLFTLLALQRQAQEATSRQAFIHVAINETRRLINYQQAVFWSIDTGQLELEKVSGNLILDVRGDYAQVIQEQIKILVKTETGTTARVKNLGARDDRYITVLFFMTSEDGLLGGLWIEGSEEFSAPEVQILEELSSTYAHALALLSLRSHRGLFRKIKKAGQYKKLLFLGLLAACLFPVRLSVTAPAEVIAKDSALVTVPFDGTMGKFEVSPGDKITENQILALMENSALVAEADMAQQAVTASEVSLSRLQREALVAPEKRADLTVMQAEIADKQIRQRYAQDMKARSEIKSPRAGIAIFSDPQQLEGKPVRTGDPIMQIADPADYEILIRIPVDAMIPLSVGDGVHFFLNVAPLGGHNGQIKSIGYEASPDPGGLLTYKVRANSEHQEDLRIGWQGTARIKTDWTILSYAILRRPLAALRHLAGW